jgi:hypothetical protein
VQSIWPVVYALDNTGCKGTKSRNRAVVIVIIAVVVGLAAITELILIVLASKY